MSYCSNVTTTLIDGEPTVKSWRLDLRFCELTDASGRESSCERSNYIGREHGPSTGTHYKQQNRNSYGFQEEMLLEDAFECVSAQIGGGTAGRRNGLAARLASIGLFRVLAPFVP
jgi:hypothetical protein